MNSSKKINVNYSSLVGLKAELLRKQTEVKDAKVSSEAIPTQPKHKVKNKKPKIKKLKIDKELIDTDDIKAHKKSKLMLEAKARLYENLKKSHSNKSEHFLVDFENKSESEEEIIHSDDYEDENSDPEEDWVEYQDCFGRTRKCLRRDLSKMQEKDDFVKHEVMKRSQGDVEVQEVRPEIVKIIPKEPEIEIMRRKWEEQTEKLTEKMNIHYQDVLFDEARAHGVGYYEFSQDEELRAKQQLNLDALRKETLRKQKEMQNLKEMKDKMEQNRIKAARIRQRVRAGLPPEPTEEELEENDKPDSDKPEAEPEIEEKNDSENKKLAEYKEQNSLVEIENKIKAFGELLGKRTQWHEMSQEEWVHKRRKDRNNEFAPVYSGFKSVGYLEARNDSLKNAKATCSLDDRVSNENTTSSSDPEITPSNDKEFRTNNTVEGKAPRSETRLTTEETICDIDTDSNDSDVIGPMPLQTEPQRLGMNAEGTFPELPESVRTELSNIDFTKPPPNIWFGTTSGISITDSEPILPTPVPPPTLAYLPMGYHVPVSDSLAPEIDSNSSTQREERGSLETSESQTSQHNLDENKITAGLKYLRANFEQQKYS